MIHNADHGQTKEFVNLFFKFVIVACRDMACDAGQSYALAKEIRE